MSDNTPAAQPLPFRDATVFDPPARLSEPPEQQPLSRLRFADGHLGWLVTSHAVTRELLADRRFSSQAKLQRSPIARPNHDEQGIPILPGTFVLMDPPEHTRFRRLLTSQFSAGRMRQLEPRITQIVEEHLDTMLHAGPPADLVQSFALPVPLLVIGELLGVPGPDRTRFQRDYATAFSSDAPEDEYRAAQQSYIEIMVELVARKRIEPDEALISELIASGELTAEEIVGVAILLLITGHETTATMLALGTFALLRHPDQFVALRNDPSLISGAVEELLRYLGFLQSSPIRAALEDVEVHGQLIKAGEAVFFSLSAANRDPTKFTDPDTLDVRRSVGEHLAFGYGIHRCLGHQLARIQLRIGLSALLRRIPTLRLAVAAQDVPIRLTRVSCGVRELPVTWKVP